ncbi:MAG TPA: lysylphosphatidylglycerol synthase transmembrane domain-containing protein [Candidatus Saccharimonadales bacterium]|nr:lysylphosphatidylglycerol synthase transmembrane domain-containing protein [Candidatus Saccharimonadales bacterium]
MAKPDSIFDRPVLQANKYRLISLGLLMLAIYVVLPQLRIFGGGLRLIEQADTKLVLAALGCVVLTYFSAALTYWFLALHRISYGKTFVVELAGAFINRLLPAGIGAMGLNYLYLQANRHSRSQAATVVAVNNFMGLAGHLLLLALLLVTVPGQSRHWHLDLSVRSWWLVLVVVLIIVSLVLSSKHLKLVLQQFGRSFIRNLRSYHSRRKRLLLALGSSILLTLLHVLGLWLCAHALGLRLSLMDSLLVLTAGISLGVAVPTPGGLGGVEAGLVGGLVATGLSSPEALTVTLLYRLLTFWLPLIAGGLAFISLRSRRLLNLT